MSPTTTKRPKRPIRRSENPTQRQAGGAGRHSSPNAGALSTGRAARFCLVTAETIVNWISAGRLTAQRTAGGQYRIRHDDLRAFMLSHGMRTDLLDCETGHSPACHEFWSARLADRPGWPRGMAAACIECPVRRSGAVRCHEVRPLLPGGTLHAPSCEDCLFQAVCTEFLDDRP
ncbi:MAG: excisionase family DNA-binding protein [Deltaproteobacteria bacterium]|nr:excisionase family DNA-binding protein [Deltaproteobacteria bacterium]